MPNLQDVMNDPQALEDSIKTMMSYRGSRGEICLNHGIRTTEELDALVRSATSVPVDVVAYRRILKLDPEVDG